VVGFTTGSREVPGKKENLWQETMMMMMIIIIIIKGTKIKEIKLMSSQYQGIGLMFRNPSFCNGLVSS
jgi:hypothetical protein